MAEPKHRGVWVYGVGVDIDAARLAGTRGVDGETLRTVDAAGLTAVVGSVDLESFGEDGLRRSLNDLPRLEAIVRTHHDVIQAVSRLGPTVPARVPAVYDDDAGVETMLEEHRQTLAEAVDRVDGRQEWGVKAYGQPPPVPAPADPRRVPRTGAGSPRPASGTAYLQQRRAAVSARDETRRTALAEAEALHSQLCRSAMACRLHRPQHAALTGDTRWMVLNGSYLLDDERSGAFRATVTRLAPSHAHLAIELTGPWPPYSFVDPVEGAA